MPSIIIRDDGSIVGIDCDEVDLSFLGKTTRQRASHVEPVSLPLRILFHVIRRLVKDESRIAEWTRCWKIRWQANLALSHGPILKGADKQGYVNRMEAIEAEIEWLNAHATEIDRS